jgi:hypothetical protein
MVAIQAALFLLLSQDLGDTRIPAGTRVDATLESSVKTASSTAGEPVFAVVTKPIQSAGRIVVPRGSRLAGRVETIEPAGHSNAGRVRLAFREIQFPDGRRTSTWITDSFSASPPNRKLRYALFISIGAAGGGLIGGKSARVAGILGGTIIGFTLANNSGNDKLPDLVLEPGRLLRLQLGEDLRLGDEGAAPSSP